MSFYIREAESMDVGCLICMGREFFNEAGLSDRGLSFDPQSLQEFLHYMMRDERCLLLVAQEDNFNVMGAIGGVMYPSMMDRSQVILNEAFWWVQKNSRHQGDHVGEALLTAFEAEGQKHGASFVNMLHLSGGRQAAFNRFYRQKGYQPSESAFFKGL